MINTKSLNYHACAADIFEFCIEQLCHLFCC